MKKNVEEKILLKNFLMRNKIWRGNIFIFFNVTYEILGDEQILINIYNTLLINIYFFFSFGDYFLFFSFYLRAKS